MTKITVESDKDMVIVPLEEWEAMKETIEILSNRRLMEDIDQGLKDHAEGKSHPIDEFWLREPDAN